ncbi:MAG: non-heme iron oxygenase ferredoxin subunit [Patescibacteria group bacterium]
MTQQTQSVRVAKVSDVAEGASLCVAAQDKALALFHVDGKWYALDNLCPHAGGPLCEGKTKDGVVTCPWHGSQFKLDGGGVVHGPAQVDVKTYPVEIRGEDVFVTLEQSAPAASPKPITLAFQPTLDAEHPFVFEGFVDELLQGLKFPFKLYGVLPFVVLAQSSDEIDVYLGKVHATEVDLQALSGVMAKLNEKWKTSITYCLFLTTQFPGVMLLNIRGPHAPMSLENTIKY